VTKRRMTRGFPGLRCPECGAGEALVIKVEDAVLTCSECDATLDRAKVEQTIAVWRRLLDWLDLAAGESDPAMTGTLTTVSIIEGVRHGT